MSLVSSYDRPAPSRPATAAPQGAPAPAVAPAHCRNCGAARVGEYCADCGQHFLEDRLTFRLLAHEAWERVVERGLLHTLRDMTARPGRVVRDYVEGRRRRYMSPLSFLLLGGALTLLVFPLTRPLLEGYLRGQLRASFLDRPHPLLTPAQAEEYVRLTMLVSQNTTYVALFVCIVFALFLRLFFRRQGINLVESSVFALFTFGYVYFVSAPFSLLLVAGMGNVQAYVYGVFPIYLVVCAATAAQYFGRPLRSALKAAVALLLSYGIFSVTLTVGIMTYLLLPRR